MTGQTLDATEQRAGGTGHILIASAGDMYTPPSDATSPPDALFTELGFTTATGVKVSDSKNVNDQEAWQSFYAIRRMVASRDFRIAFEMLQWNSTNISLAFGGGEVTGTTGAFHYTPPDPSVIAEYAVLVDVHDGNEVLRWFAPRMTVVETVETSFVRTEDAVLPITFSVLGVGTGNPWDLWISTEDPNFDVTGNVLGGSSSGS